MNYEFYDEIGLMNNVTPFNNGVIEDYNSYANENINNNYNNFDIVGENANLGYQNGNNLNLFNTYEGYLKGNAFKNEYIPYKNYKVAKLTINSEKEEMMINIGQYSFMMHDLNLYLDVHPDDANALKKFTEYRNKLNELITNYERKYGPLAVKGSVDNKIPFEWENNNWPWGN